MDTLTFLAEETRALAWPSVVVVAFFVFRYEFTKMLGRIRRFRWSRRDGMDVSLDEALNEAKDDAAAAGVKVRAYLDSNLVPEKGDLQDALLEMPYLSILQSWSGVESQLRRLVTKHLRRPDAPSVRFPHRVALRLLLKKEVIDRPTFDLIVKLYEIRNRVLHEQDAWFSREEALDYYGLATGLINKLAEK